MARSKSISCAPRGEEMVNPQIEVLTSEGEEVDSVEMGRIVPIYEAVGYIWHAADSSRDLRHAAESRSQYS